MNVEEIIDVYFGAVEKIAEYFDTDLYEGLDDHRDDEWTITGRSVCWGEYVKEEDWDEGEWTYREDVRSCIRKDGFVLIKSSLCTGDNANMLFLLKNEK